MRNFKKFLALVLAMLMIVSAAATVSAFSDVPADNDFAAAIEDLSAKKIVTGKGDNKFDPNGNVKRYEAAIMFARAMTGEVESNDIWNQGLTSFSDVKSYQYAIELAVSKKVINGYGDGKFGPEDPILYTQALKMAVCALGYGEGLEWGNKGMPYYNVAADLGLVNGLGHINDPEKVLTRAEFTQIIANMIYVELADGSECFAAQNFNLKTAENVTTMVIVETAKQSDTNHTTDPGMVGVRKLINGIPAGEVYYLLASEFGFATADVAEAHFHDAYDFINWDGKTATAIEPAGTKTTIYDNNVTVDSNDATKVTINNIVYYIETEPTGSLVKNELVVFEDSNSSTTGKKELGIGMDGKAYGADSSGNPVTLNVMVSPVTGEILYLVTADGSERLTFAEATEKYGVVLSSGSTLATTLAQMPPKADNNTHGYQAVMYDDDGDGNFDRAYTSTVYVKKHQDPNSDGKLTYAPYAIQDGSSTILPEKNTLFVDANGAATTVAKDTWYKFTYNRATNTTVVLDTYSSKTGKLTQIIGNGTWNSYVIDGTTYYNKGYTVKESGLKFEVGKEYTLVAKGNELLEIKYKAAASSTPNTAATPLVVFAKYKSIDSNGVTAEVYDNGVKKDMTISAVKVDGNFVSLKLTDVLLDSNCKAVYEDIKANAVGNFYKVDSSDATKLIPVTISGNAVENYELYDQNNGTKTVVFNAGLADVYGDNSYIAPANMLKTDANTKFVFIFGTTTKEVKAYTGAATTGWKLDLNQVDVYADSFSAGTASSVVYVIGAKAGVIGFGINDASAPVQAPTTYVYTTKDLDGGKYVQAKASDFGFTSDSLKDKMLRKYTGNAINLNDGTAVDVLYIEVTADEKLSANTIYKIDSNGFAVSAGSDVKTATISAKANVVKVGDYWYIDTLTNKGTKITKLITLKDNESASAIATDSNSKFKDGATEIRYIDDTLDGIFVAIIAH